jgi:integrase
MELELERERRGESVGSGALIFPSVNDPSEVIDSRVIARWLRAAEKLAGLEPMERGGWHGFRRMWACQRKALPPKDVAHAGGWRDIGTLQTVYQAADAETLERL